MKSNLGNINDCCVEKPFPKLVKMVRSGNIYLMFDEERGMFTFIDDRGNRISRRLTQYTFIDHQWRKRHAVRQTMGVIRKECTKICE